jgi:hypothetical protein
MRLIARPFRTYRELRAGPPPSVRIGLARFLFVIGCFVSLTATGRFTPFETLSAMVSFSWLPVAHFVGLAAARRLFAREVPLARVYGLFLESLGPWMLVFVATAGLCLFAPRPAGPIFTLLPPLAVLATMLGVVSLYALFREALEVARLRAALATLTFYVVMLLVVLGYYFAAGQLWPILPW